MPHLILLLVLSEIIALSQVDGDENRTRTACCTQTGQRSTSKALKQIMYNISRWTKNTYSRIFYIHITAAPIALIHGRTGITGARSASGRWSYASAVVAWHACEGAYALQPSCGFLTADVSPKRKCVSNDQKFHTLERSKEMGSWLCDPVLTSKTFSQTF